MARSLHVRLDDASAAALEIVRAGGLSDSEAVRTALREAAARRRLRSAVRDEVRRLAADEHDREEMRLVREELCRAGEASDRCWVITAGLVDVRAASGRAPGAEVITRQRKGSTVGVVPAILGEAQPETVTASIQTA